MTDIVEQAARVLAEHRRATGMQVASGNTCRCGYWDGAEVPGETRPAGLSGLTWHRAQALVDAGLLRAPAQAEMERLTRLIAATTALTGVDAKTLVEAVQELGKPTRTVPSREGIARAILMVSQVENIDPNYAWDVQFAEVQDELLAHADSVLELFAAQPTVAEIKAQALEEAADDLAERNLLVKQHLLLPCSHALMDVFVDTLRVRAAVVRAGER